MIRINDNEVYLVQFFITCPHGNSISTDKNVPEMLPLCYMLYNDNTFMMCPLVFCTIGSSLNI